MPGIIQKLAPEFEKLVREGLEATRASHQDVLSLSDFYLEHPGKATPWETSFAIPATLVYFMPLNYARMASAFREVRRFLAGAEISEIWDFGSGTGTTQWVLEDEAWLEPRPLYSVEVSRPARELHDRLEKQRGGRWRNEHARAVQPKPGALAVFSYSFLEMQEAPPDLKKFEHLLIVEPSTRDQGRDLLEWRARLIQQGFTPLAPCTHAQACPLLTKSERDWCHQRIHFAAPDWWLEIESKLPMKNRTLTYAYLLMSQSASHGEWAGATRVIGDTRKERGKTRQMICRGPEREFFSWLERHGPSPQIPHGALVKNLGEYETKSSELRVGSLEWTE